MVAPLLSHLRAEARHRWAAWLAVTVLIGLIGGMVLGALAGARRTHTAYDRLVADTEAWDVLVNPNLGIESAIGPDDVAALPQAAEVSALDGVAAMLVDGGSPTLGSGPLVLAARDHRVLVDFNRPRVVEGRLYDPADAGEVMVDDRVAAHYGVHAGDAVQIATADMEDLYEWEMSGAEGPPPVVPRDVVVSAVITPHDAVVEDQAFDYGQVYLTPAFAEAHELEPAFFGMAVRLAPGASATELRRAVQALAPTEPIEFKTGAAVRDTVARGSLPHTNALLLFAAVVGAAGLVVAAQATARQLAPLRREALALSALGVDRRQLRSAGLIRCALLIGAGSVLALGVAVALSPLFPLGIADRAEIDPGLDVDLSVLLPGVGVIALVLLLWCAAAAQGIGRPAAAPVRARRTGPLDRLIGSLSDPVASTGLRAAMATSPVSSRSAVRGAMVGLGLAVAAVTATVTFGASIDHLVSTPAAFGWGWDAHVTLPGEEWDTPPEEIIARVAESRSVEGWSVLTVDQVELDGERVPAVGIEYRRGEVGPTILEGRRPESPTEVVLGGRTMDRLGVSIGDEVAAGAEGRTMRVVGQAVFPGLGTYPGADRTELGKGALFAREALDEVGERFGFASVVLEAADDEQLSAAIDEVLGDQAAAIDIEEIEVFRSPAQPADIRALARVRSTPLAIAAVLAILGGSAFAFVLVAGVRGRRREIALLKTFGFRRRDVAATVAWQATATAIAACAAGIPLGVVAGRLAWSVLADVLGVGGDGRIPVRLLGIPLGVVLVANLLAVVPGAVAARTRPAPMLRAE